MENCKVPITWEMLHETILKPFCMSLRGNNSETVLKRIFPENVFHYLFNQVTYSKALVDDVYYGLDDAEKAFTSFRNAVIEAKNNGHVFDIDSFPILKQFQSRWEELIPNSKFSAECQNDDSRYDPLSLAIDDLLAEIIDERVKDHLDELNEQGRYSLVLAKLSFIATSLSCFCSSNEKYSKKNLEFQAVFLPLPEKMKKVKKESLNEMGYDRLDASEIKLTWKKLHEDVFQRLNPDPQYCEINKFFGAIMPDSFLSKICGTKEGNITLKNIGNVYHAKNGAKPRFELAQEFINSQNSKTGEPYTWDTLPIISDFRAKWETLIPAAKFTALECGKTEDSNAREMQAVVEDLLDAIPSERLNVAVRIRGITKSEPHSMVLAILSVIASTLFCFSGEKQNTEVEDTILYERVLPPLPKKDSSSALQKFWEMLDVPEKSLSGLEKELQIILEDPVEIGEANFLLYQKAMKEGNTAQAEIYLENASNAGYLPANRVFNENVAKRLLDEAQDIFHSKIIGFDSDCLDEKCCSNCETILRMPTYIPREYRGEASYILYKCIFAKKYSPTTGETAEYYLELSHMYGHSEATKDWKKRNNSTIVPQPERSDCQIEGLCYCNEVNRYTEASEKTIPDSWGGALEELNLSSLVKDVVNPIPRRFLLLSDNFSQNLSDLFQALQLIKENKPDPKRLNWEFFVRHDSESIHSLVDTALSRLSEYKIPVYILNDSKIAAQQLLSQHPLFYPVRALKLDKIKQTGDHRPLLHFVVIGNSPVTEWLVREAFWMMGFRDNVIRSRITVLAEDGKEVEESVKGRFPGMSRDITKIEKIELPEIKGEKVPLESAELQRKIQEYTRETDYCYFAVATDSDEGNLTLAIRVREALIRAAIESQKEEMLDRMPPVAFLCRNDEIAWLSKCMVVEKEKYGNAWFNTRALIPFGEVSNRYHFDNINGGTFDMLAKCIHFQYSQLEPEEVHSATPEALAAEKDYYLRQYNQDSSYSIALGMPYRIFQFKDKNDIQVTPTCWNILQSTSFDSVSQLHFMAVRMKKFEDTEEKAEIKAIAEWEHARWVRWLLSRGWCTATLEDSLFAKDAQNPRPQLFAAKMHPALCSYEAQNELGTRLNKDFYSYDYWNIEATKQLLDLEWVEIPTKSRGIER